MCDYVSASGPFSHVGHLTCSQLNASDCIVAPRIVLHFHPGWGFADGTALDAIATSSWYRSRWQTGTSNGGPTAYRGGDRWRWESTMFQGRYDDAPNEDRPVYGAWNRRDDVYGASPRFGSAYLRLRPDLSRRATFCWPDSVYHPQTVGVRRSLSGYASLPILALSIRAFSRLLPQTFHSTIH